MRLFALALPTELADGRIPAPAWAIVGLGGLVIAGTAVYVVIRFLLGSKEKR